MIGQAFVTCPINRSSWTYRQWKHVDFKKGYSPKESAFVFQEKKKKAGSARQATTNHATLAKSGTEFQRVSGDPETQ